MPLRNFVFIEKIKQDSIIEACMPFPLRVCLRKVVIFCQIEITERKLIGF